MEIVIEILKSKNENSINVTWWNIDIDEVIKTKADCDYLINMLQSVIDDLKLIKEQTK